MCECLQEGRFVSHGRNIGKKSNSASLVSSGFDTAVHQCLDAIDGATRKAYGRRSLFHKLQRLTFRKSGQTLKPGASAVKPALRKREDELQCCSVNVDVFVTSTTGCDLDL